MRVVKTLAVVCCFAGALGASAQTGDRSGGWQPAPGHKQMPIWPGAAPDPQPVKGQETVSVDPTFLVAGRTVAGVNNVTRPTMTVYSPKGKNTGVAVVVFPGGGYQMLAIDLEGTEVCDWLTAHGITCVLLKYRVTDVGLYAKSGPYPESPMALEDAQRTMGLVREHAAEWGIDPNKIGVLGFSAGGGMVANISNHYRERVYAPVDVADRLSCRPDFAVAVYPGHLSLAAAEYDATFGTKKFALGTSPDASIGDPDLELNPNLHPTRQTPPTFIVEAEDDHIDSVYDALAYYIALQRAGVPAEMHLYAQGNHAYGLRPTKLPITHWPELMETWLHTIGMLPQS
jgi:acetyl esterase/lipase